MITLAREFRKTPFLKLVIPFIAGIICQLLFPFNWMTIFVLLILAMSALITLSLIHFPENYSYGFAWGIVLFVLLFIIGSYVTAIRIEKSKLPDNILAADASIIEITDLPVVNTKSFKAAAKIIAYRYQSQWYSSKAKCNIYIAIDSASNNIRTGDKLLVNVKFRQIDGPISPYQFDYKKYFYYKGIQLQLFTHKENIINLPGDNNSLQARILKIRHFLVNKFNSPIIDKREKAVISALVLGFTGDLDPELKNAYARAGVMHILSVSGMHVGIVYIFLLYLLFFLDKTRKLKIIKAAIIICGIWFYALITGFSPPVIRSAAMLSFFAAGQAINRNSNGFNTLAASAFIILLCNPFQITDIGFQLSYSAIAGILLFYEPIYHAWTPALHIADKIWALVAVSIAAQLGTLPLSLFYFHQFPTFFIPTNLVIVPLSGLIIYGGLTLLIFSFWSPAGFIISFLLKYMLISLNWLVVTVENIPGSSIQNIYLSIPDAIIVAIIIIIVAAWIKNHLKLYIVLFLVCVFTFATFRAGRLISNENQKILIVHNTSNYNAITIINHHECLTISDSAIFTKINASSVNMRLAYDIRKCYLLFTDRIARDTCLCHTYIHPFTGHNFYIVINNKKIILLTDKRLHEYKFQTKQLVDFLILNEKSGIKINDATKYFIPSKIITGFSKKNNLNMPSERCEKNKISVFFVAEQGLFKADL
jgi:competence protein ComEC